MAAVTNSIRRLLLSLVLACPLVGVATAAACREAEREPREVREPREDRSDRGGDRDRAADRQDSSGRREREPGEDRGGRSGREDRSGRGGGEDRSGKDDRSGRGGDDDRGGRDDDSGNSGRRTPIDVERNARGGDRERAEVLLIGPGNVADAVRGAGYSVVSEQRLQSLQQSLLRIRVRDNESIEQAINTLRQRVPEVRAAPNHVFRPMGEAPVAGKLSGAPAMVAAPANLAAARIGIIDTGADTTLAPLRGVVQATRGFASGGYLPRAHGSAVAQLASAQGAAVAVCDVFGVDSRQRLVAPADAIAAAIDWLLSGNLRVINISIEGPRNEVLEFVIDAALARGTAIVAAVGNGGPAAPPGYPAAYPGVIAVTALDEKGLVYRRAGRGKQVQFAARGSFPGNGAPVLSAEPVSGTSFAAPLVAAEIERRWQANPAATREQIVAELRRDAVDLGEPGWDPVYGWGRIDSPR